LNGFKKFLVEVNDYFLMVYKTLKGLFVPPYYFNDVIHYMETIGVHSLPIVVLTSSFTGMILALQSGYEMAIFGAKMYVGTLVSLTLIRELGPVLTGIVVAGRVGAGISAELGSMKVTEQIAAMRSMAIDPIKKLVVPRFWAGFFVIPALTLLSDLLGILGGAFIAMSTFGISPVLYKKTVLDALVLDDIALGLIKPFFFAAIIITVGCYAGLGTQGGTEGVGKSTTKSVVISSVLILVTDYFLNVVLMKLLGM